MAVEQGHFSLVRWRPDVTRDEARNIALILVSPLGTAFRSVPLSSVSQKLREQGLLDSILTGLQSRFVAQRDIGVETLEEIHSTLRHSVYATHPQPIAVSDLNRVIDGLYRAYLQPRSGGGRQLTKGVVLDQVVEQLRRSGRIVSRGKEMGDFIFDAVIEDAASPRVLEVISFATTRKDWVPVLHDVGHFLYALDSTHLQGTAVIQPPTLASSDTAGESFARVQRWLVAAKVDWMEPAQLVPEQGKLA